MSLAVLFSVAATAQPTVIDFEDLVEGPQGIPFVHQGITWYDLNNVSGVFPGGDPFGPQPYDQAIVEDATLFYFDFPEYGSPVNALTFGTSWIPGESLSLGRLSTVTLDLDAPAVGLALDIGYYEDGPWGGIVYHLDALAGTTVVASDSFILSDGGGRDNLAVSRLAVAGPPFDHVQIYATYGAEYSMPRALIDDLTIRYATDGPTFTRAPW